VRVASQEKKKYDDNAKSGDVGTIDQARPRVICQGP